LRVVLEEPFVEPGKVVRAEQNALDHEDPEDNQDRRQQSLFKPLVEPNQRN